MNREPYEGEIILINKDLRWTSFDVVKKIRNVLRVKKVGHAGTLDPLATGLLIICTGRMTKRISRFMEMEKEYAGSMVLGQTTPSVDLETEVSEKKPIDHITKEDIYNMAGRFRGKIMQEPPIYSAIKKNGKPLYKKARRGETVKIEPREVEAKVFEITNVSLPKVDFRLVCSKGFYVRSLVRDFGEALGIGAYLASLVRTRIGPYELNDAKTIEEYISGLEINEQ